MLHYFSKFTIRRSIKVFTHEVQYLAELQLMFLEPEIANVWQTADDTLVFP
jgi:hypothetical protein